MGISLAYWMEQLTDWKITIIEKEGIAAGATGRNAGFITAGSAVHFHHLFEKYGEAKAIEIWNYCQENITRKLEVAKNLKVKMRIDGSTTFAAEEILNTVHSIFEKNNLRSKFVDNPQFGKGLKFTNEVGLSSRDLLAKIFATLARTTLKIQKVVEVPIDGITFIATNFLEDFELPFKNEVRPVRAQIQRNEFLERPNFPHGNCYIPKARIYFREDSSALLIGGLRVLDSQKEETFKLEENDLIQNSLSDFTIKNFGKLLSSQRWCGIMSFTKDELPIYRNINDTHFIGGFSGHGNGFAFLAAKKWVEKIILGLDSQIFPF